MLWPKACTSLKIAAVSDVLLVSINYSVMRSLIWTVLHSLHVTH